MFVSAERVLGVSVGAAQLRLANLIRDGWLGEAANSAYQGGMDHLLRVGPLGDTPGASRLVRVRFLDPVGGDGATTVAMRWEAIGVTGGLFPVLDADIKLSGEPDQGTRLAVTGCYRPPLGMLGAGLDKILMHTVADLTLRSLLTRLAGALEDTVRAAEEAPAPWQWDTGPQVAPG